MAIQMGGVLPYKLEVYCRTNWSQVVGVGVSETLPIWDLMLEKCMPQERTPLYWFSGCWLSWFSGPGRSSCPGFHLRLGASDCAPWARTIKKASRVSVLACFSFRGFGQGGPKDPAVLRGCFQTFISWFLLFFTVKKEKTIPFLHNPPHMQKHPNPLFRPKTETKNYFPEAKAFCLAGPGIFHLLPAAHLPPVQKRDAQHMFLKHRGAHADCQESIW